jgi:hypothetical protein
VAGGAAGGSGMIALAEAGKSLEVPDGCSGKFESPGATSLIVGAVVT